MSESANGEYPQPTERETLHQFLNENDTQKYYVDYKVAMSNHISHALVALAGLGASPNQIEAFVTKYSTKLESAEPFLASAPTDSVDKLLGSREGFYALMQHYEKELGEDVNEAVGRLFPQLGRGMIGSATHGLIHLGNALLSGCRNTVVEGLAYMHFGYMPLETEKSFSDIGQGTEDAISLAHELRDSSLGNEVARKVRQAPWKDFATGFQNRAGVLVTVHADTLFELVQRLSIPGFEEKGNVKERAVRLGRWLIDIALTVYVKAEWQNDFFLLHGVTAAWALLQILPCLTTHADVSEAVGVYLCSLFAVYVIQGCPRLLDSPITAHEESWEKVASLALDPPKEDEHIYKLVYVAMEMSKVNQESPLYKHAAFLALEHPLHFGHKHEG